MAKSEQSKDLGQKWFKELQDEISEAVELDSMGFYEKEGVDDED